MSKIKKEPYSDGNSNTLRRTVPNHPSTSRKSESHNSCSDSTSSSSDSSPDRKKKKYDKPNPRGSDSGIVFKNKDLKRYSITIRNKVKPPKLRIANPEEITMIRRPGRSQDPRRRTSSSSDSKYEGARPIFDKIETKDRSVDRSPEARNSSSRRERSRKKRSSRNRRESPSYRMKRSRKESPHRSKHRRSISSPSRHSSSSDSSTSSDERSQKKKYYYKLKAEREEKERRRKEYERELYVREMREREMRERERREMKAALAHSAHSNGSKMVSYSRERSKEVMYRPKEPPGPYPRSRSPESPPSPPLYYHPKERPKEPPVPYPYMKERKEYSRERVREYSDEEEVQEERVEYHHPVPSHSQYMPPHQPQPMVRPMYPVRMPPAVPVHPMVPVPHARVPVARPPVPGMPRPFRPRPPYVMRPGMRPFTPPMVPGYPPPVGYYPRPRLPVPFRPPIRHPPRPPPPRGYILAPRPPPPTS